MPDNKAENGNEKIPESEVSKLIKAVRQAYSYDDIGTELYYEMCQKKGPIYDEWVATWLLKCIEEAFSKYPYKKDIMRASFALLPKYDLGTTTVQERLDCYLDESNYLSKYPSSSKRPLEDIKLDPNGQKELADIRRKLRRMDSNCLQELIKYIEELTNQRSHIENLSAYGTLVSLPNGKKGYKPKLKELYYPRKKCDHVKISQNGMEASTETVAENETTNGNATESEDSTNKIEGRKPATKFWKKILLIVLCSIIAVIVVAFIVWKWHDKSSLEDRDTGAETIEEMPKYKPQNRIVNLDEPDEYDVEAFFDGLIDFIIRSPLYGDMVAQGLSDLDEAFTNPNPWLTEFVEKTDAAMELPPTQHPRGMEYWMEYREGEGNNLFTTDEYFHYAAHVCGLLEKFTILGIREWEYSASWEIPAWFVNSSDRAQKTTEKATQPALILEYISKKTGKVRFVIGFSLEDGHLLIYDPEIAQ